MCGIFGQVRWDDEPLPIDRLQRATNLLTHRGPDGGGYWTAEGVFLGHRRLAIIDLRPEAAQPMRSTCGRYLVTYNGEIYNYVELRHELEQLGRRFRTASDTEVILEAYAQWGTDAMTHLRGMFAFAIVDRRERTLLLARDRFGEKPLLIREEPSAVTFASELAPLAALAPGRGRIDPKALAGYLSLNYVPGDRTLMAGVGRVPPGSWVEYGPGGRVRRQRYWTLPVRDPNPDTRPLGALVDEFQSRLDEAIRLSLRSDVPVGLFLSGGVDSSLVAESAARQGRLAVAFSVDMAEAGFSEWAAADRVAKRLDLEIERVPFSADALADFVDISRHADDPLADSSALAVWTVARAAGHRLKVVLSGDGGDELFGGYLTYVASAMHRRLSRWQPAWLARRLASLAHALPTNDRRKVSTSYKLHRFLRALDRSTAEAHLTWSGTWLPEQAARLLRDDAHREQARHALAELLAAHAVPARATLDDLQRLDAIEYLPNDILVKVDRMTMAHSLESRAPLLDPDVAAFALGLPPIWRADARGRTKVLLREACARHFGRAHADAPKQGFSIPIHRWLRGPARPLMDALLAPDRVAAVGVLDETAVADAKRAHVEDGRALGWELWGLMVLVTWFEERVMTPPSLTASPSAPLQDMRDAVA